MCQSMQHALALRARCEGEPREGGAGRSRLNHIAVKFWHPITKATLEPPVPMTHKHELEAEERARAAEASKHKRRRR